ncbi:MAG: hypothetical protein D6723_06320 [Acidobacteria bacterium]|nr:MAG: hypothetical protein D6723_06320 [Acidobacteriota bacterium]
MMIVLMGMSGLGYAQFGSQSKGSSDKTSMSVEKVKIEGELRALPEMGSATKDRPAYVLKVLRATSAEGRELESLRGTMLRLGNSEQSRRLVRLIRPGEKVIVKGHLHQEEKTLEVMSFKKARQPESRGSGTRIRGSGTK